MCAFEDELGRLARTVENRSIGYGLTAIRGGPFPFGN